MSSFLLAEIETMASRPTLEEMLKRLEALPHVDLPSSAAELIRQERDSR